MDQPCAKRGRKISFKDSITLPLTRSSFVLIFFFIVKHFFMTVLIVASYPFEYGKTLEKKKLVRQHSYSNPSCCNEASALFSFLSPCNPTFKIFSQLVLLHLYSSTQLVCWCLMVRRDKFRYRSHVCEIC